MKAALALVAESPAAHGRRLHAEPEDEPRFDGPVRQYARAPVGPVGRPPAPGRGVGVRLRRHELPRRARRGPRRRSPVRRGERAVPVRRDRRPGPRRRRGRGGVGPDARAHRPRRARPLGAVAVGRRVPRGVRRGSARQAGHPEGPGGRRGRREGRRRRRAADGGAAQDRGVVPRSGLAARRHGAHRGAPVPPDPPGGGRRGVVPASRGPRLARGADLAAAGVVGHREEPPGAAPDRDRVGSAGPRRRVEGLLRRAHRVRGAGARVRGAQLRGARRAARRGRLRRRRPVHAVAGARRGDGRGHAGSGHDGRGVRSARRDRGGAVRAVRRRRAREPEPPEAGRDLGLPRRRGEGGRGPREGGLEGDVHPGGRCVPLAPRGGRGGAPRGGARVDRGPRARGGWCTRTRRVVRTRRTRPMSGGCSSRRSRARCGSWTSSRTSSRAACAPSSSVARSASCPASCGRPSARRATSPCSPSTTRATATSRSSSCCSISPCAARRST
jgi:hypothetical protein